MKTIPPPCPEPVQGPNYWRSLDQLAESPEVRPWLEREFPAGASEFTDETGRRAFLKLMSASMLFAGIGLTGCRRPEEKILPFSKMPAGYIHGVSQFYATSVPTRGGSLPVVVRSHEGRPVKIEANTQHPLGNIGTDHLAQASILNLYDADRATRHTGLGNAVDRAVATDHLTEVAATHKGNQGAGLAFLVERSSSPSRQRLQASIAATYPRSKWVTFEPTDGDVQRTAVAKAFGPNLRSSYNFEKATCILSLDFDFVGGEDNSARYIRGFAQNRKVAKPTDVMSRLYVVESLFTLAGASADHRLRKSPSAIATVAAQFAEAIVKGASVADKWIAECAKDLIASKGKALVVAGIRQPLEVHLLALAMNNALGALGTTLSLLPAVDAKESTLAEVIADLNAGTVQTLVIVGGNPVYNVPADLNFSAAAKKAKEVLRLGYYEDETFPVSTWHYAAAHYLESWGDGRSADGTYVPVQPLIEPLFGGMTDLEFLARLSGVLQPSSYEIVQATFKELAGGADFENSWGKFLHDGFLAKSAPAISAVPFSLAALPAVAQVGVASISNLEAVFHNSYSMDDGRYNNNGWLQELPDPISKITWDNAVLLSPKTAEELGLSRNSQAKDGRYINDVVEIEVDGRKVRGAVWIQPGLADYTIGLALGYGRERTGRIGIGTGYNAYAIRSSANLHAVSGVKLTKTGQTYELATTQEHGLMDGRPIIREGNLDQFKAKPDFAKNMDIEAHAPNAGGIYKHPYDANPSLKSDVHQWGMAIDLNSCVGCNACVMACQSENNIPIVGKEQVRRGREMQWLRIDRYFSSAAKHRDQFADDPQMVVQPMLCQHCESAPCESVCPVNATVHDEEGLNVMAYNRCVGTRYCSNNCPYKVRRFNFFDYNRRTLDQLKGPWYPTPMLNQMDGEFGLKRWWNNPDRGYKPEDEWELTKLVKNPDVSVRMRGVMEKCTFCVQRIENAKITQKVKAGASGNVQVPEGTFTTACAQACPADAIAFGNLLDKTSRVSQLKNQDRNYSVLGFLDTKPRTTYLARIRNPNPAMPDFHKEPLSLEEYIEQHGSPMETHGAHGAAATNHPAAQSGQKGAH
ncbi:MAG: 4Fe-4S dicluster domain-containing protein [Pedosphaera sp.]|nr:4Fe-4S dicluster domain-containing protein [Pedosphaera sp.]